MGTTPICALPYPELTDVANVPADMRELAEAVEGSFLGQTGVAFGWAKASAAQSIPTAVVTPLSGLTLDPGSVGMAMSGQSLRAPTNGLYLINAFVTLTFVAAGARSIFVRRNTASYLRITGATGTGSSNTMAGSMVYPLVAGDLIDVGVYQSSGAALATDPNTGGVSVQLVRL